MPSGFRSIRTSALPILLSQKALRDLHWDQPERNWLANNLLVAAAFAEAGYDFRLVLGDGGHSPNHGEVLLPDALRWVFRAPQSAPSGQLEVDEVNDAPGTDTAPSK